MSSAAKTLAAMQRNPRDWQIDSLVSVAKAHQVAVRHPGGSHVVFRHPKGGTLSVPAHRPIKPIYIRKFVQLIEQGAVE